MKDRTILNLLTIFGIGGSIGKAPVTLSSPFHNIY
ncbi:hypothetical protein QFZ73_005828 [Peribacillus sp. V2I11]|nr:hypothetical protein [Peribacillus sp. V2I11]